jgi:hypothetical protein
MTRKIFRFRPKRQIYFERFQPDHYVRFEGWKDETKFVSYIFTLEKFPHFAELQFLGKLKKNALRRVRCGRASYIVTIMLSVERACESRLFFHLSVRPGN